MHLIIGYGRSLGKIRYSGSATELRQGHSADPESCFRIACMAT
jgi:hypothetical protein